MKLSIQDFKESKCQREILEFIHTFNHPKIELYSFELKVEIKQADVKKIYFQAVSNSSWANYGYLAVFNPIDDFVKDELRKLNARFGIGVINFGIPKEDDEHDEWEIIFQAQRQDSIDLSMLNDLGDINEDFRKFIDNITKDAQAKREEPIKEHFDKCLEYKEILHYIEQHNIKREE